MIKKIIIIASQRSGQLFKLPEWLSRQNARICYSDKQHKESIKLQLFQIDNKDKSKHSKNSVKQQIQTNICERMPEKIECQSGFECLCQDGSKHLSRTCVAVAQLNAASMQQQITCMQLLSHLCNLVLRNKRKR